MRDFYNCGEVKNIVDQEWDYKRKIIKNYIYTLNILNRIGRKDENYSYTMSLSTNNLYLLI